MHRQVHFLTNVPANTVNIETNLESKAGHNNVAVRGDDGNVLEDDDPVSLHHGP